MIISKSYKKFSAKLAEHYYLQAFKVCIKKGRFRCPK